MNKEELLEYARKHYPIGTQYVPVHVGIGINEVVDTDYNYDGGSTEYIHVKSKHIENSFSGCIYRDGEWAKIVSKPEEKPQFEVGKWYKLEANHLIKTWYLNLKSETDTSYLGDFINDNKGFNTNGVFDKALNYILTKLTDLSEIQDYLPEGHPDKIVKPKSLIGRYLKCLKTNSWGDGKTAIGEYLKITDADNCGDFVINNTGAWFSHHRIKKGEYELMPEGFEPKNEIVKQKISEYLECIPSRLSQSYAIVGRIYKFVKTSGEHWGVECNLDCAGYGVGSVLYFCPEQFKPSTKEAYDRQQPIKKQWIPKVGDWVVSLVDRLGYRKKGDVFQILEVSNDCIYYAQNTNGYINTFRPAEPHEIPKENLKPSVPIPAYMVDGVCTTSPSETKPEIDSWCILLTEENRELLLQNKHVFKADWSFDNLKHHYGITKFNVPSYYSGVTHFDKVLTTEEFCKKFNITESYKQVEIDFSVPIKQMKISELKYVYEQLYKKENQQSKINKVKVELIPVKKLIKN